MLSVVVRLVRVDSARVGDELLGQREPGMADRDEDVGKDARPVELESLPDGMNATHPEAAARVPARLLANVGDVLEELVDRRVVAVAELRATGTRLLRRIAVLTASPEAAGRPSLSDRMNRHGWRRHARARQQGRGSPKTAISPGSSPARRSAAYAVSPASPPPTIAHGVELLDGACEEPLDEVALEREEHDERDGERDEGRGAISSTFVLNERIWEKIATVIGST